jgi:DDE superfamily endonuclease
VAAEQQGAAAESAWLVFFDESAGSLIPPVRRTWSPRGRTPILRHRFGWKKASMAAALGYRPDTTAARLCFHLQQPSYDTDRLIGVLEQLASFSTDRRVVLIWDGLSAHWSTKMRALGPASATTDSSISVPMTCSPAPTDSASSPSRAEWAISPSATETCSGMVSSGLLAWRPGSGTACPWRSPSLVVLLADHPRPPRRQDSGGGDRHLNFHELRDNLSGRARHPISGQPPTPPARARS